MSEDEAGKIIAIGLAFVLKDTFDTEFYKQSKTRSSLDNDKFQAEWCVFERCFMELAILSSYGQNDKSNSIISSFHDYFLKCVYLKSNISGSVGDIIRDRYSSYIKSYNNKSEPGHVHWVSKTICENLGLDQEDSGNILPMAEYFSCSLVNNKRFVDKIKVSADMSDTVK